MEIGILVAAAVAVAAIAAYFYASNVKNSQTNTGQAALDATNSLGNVTNSTITDIENL